jgi:hypothetical protein
MEGGKIEGRRSMKEHRACFRGSLGRQTRKQNRGLPFSVINPFVLSRTGIEHQSTMIRSNSSGLG